MVKQFKQLSDNCRYSLHHLLCVSPFLNFFPLFFLPFCLFLHLKLILLCRQHVCFLCGIYVWQLNIDIEFVTFSWPYLFIFLLVFSPFLQLVLNRVLMLGSATQTIIGRPILSDAAVHAVVEEHVSLAVKVLLFIYLLFFRVKV